MDAHNISGHSPSNSSTILDPHPGSGFSHDVNPSSLSETCTSQVRPRSLRLRTARAKPLPSAKIQKARYVADMHTSPVSGEFGLPSSRHQNAGTALSHSAASPPARESQFHKRHCRKAAHHHRSGRRLSSTTLSRVNLMTWYARRSVEQASNWLRPKPLLMDVILDLKLRYDEDALIKLLRNFYCHELTGPSSLCSYPFTDGQSLDTYWADQAAIWRGMWTIEQEAFTNRFPNSNERFTGS